VPPGICRIYKKKNVDVEENSKTVKRAEDALVRFFGESSRRMFAWPVLAGKVLRTLRETRNPVVTMFAWQSNINYRNVSIGS
jgi:hypothetical protein